MINTKICIEVNFFTESALKNYIVLEKKDCTVTNLEADEKKLIEKTLKRVECCTIKIKLKLQTNST